jgi:hypothetical protein
MSQLTTVGTITSVCTGCAESHIGVFIPCCTNAEIAAHSQLKVSEPSARGARHVTFDYQLDKYPRFQSSANEMYWTPEADIFCYPILDVDAAAVHRACVEAAEIRPFNSDFHRCNGLCCGFWPCAWPSNTPLLAASTCVALTMRIVARAKSNSRAAFTSDRETLRVLAIPSRSCAAPCAPSVLTAYSPRECVTALQEASVVGAGIRGFAAGIAACNPMSMSAALVANQMRR